MNGLSIFGKNYRYGIKRMDQRNDINNIIYHFDRFKSYRKTIVISLMCILITFITNCSNQPSMTLTVQHRQVLSGIPSASGVVRADNVLYVIGDNLAWLYQLDDHYEITDKVLLLGGITDSILPKASKPDFEAMTTIQNNSEVELLIFGSGSKSPERDVIARVRLKDRTQTIVDGAASFYNAIRSSKHLDAESLNIEAAATVGNALFLFNREHNLILEFSLNDIIDFLNGLNDLPTYKVYSINLPLLNGLNAKFSGASAVPNSQQLVFTASVEDTPNTYDDGKVLGSYVGIIDIEDLKNGYQPLCKLITDDLKPISIKVESVEVLDVFAPNELKIVLVTDSDGGESELLVCKLKW